MKRSFSGLNHDVRSESGQTLVLVALSMTVLMGFLGLAIDVGNLRTAQHKMQQVADAAALAGALELSYCGGTPACTAMTTAAQKAMTENGLSGATLMTQCTGSEPATGYVLMLNNGPCLLSSSTDPNYGSTKVVEAKVTQEDAPTYFSRVFGINKITISARAEAGRGNSPYCFYNINNPTTGTNAQVTVKNGAKLTANCGGQDDGNMALSNGSSSHITTTLYNVDGTISGSTAGMSPPPTNGGGALTDPLNWLQSDEPPAPTDPTSSSCDNSSIATANPSTFVWDSAKSTWDVKGVVNVSQSYASGATYDVSVPNPAYGTTGSEPVVTICGNIDIQSGGQLQLSGPSSGVIDVFTGSVLADVNAGTSYTWTDSSGNVQTASNTVMAGTNITMYFSAGNISDLHGNNVVLTAPNQGPLEAVLYYAPPTNTTTLNIDNGSKSSWQGMVYLPGGIVDVNGGGNLAAYTMFISNQMILDSGAAWTMTQDFSSLSGGGPILGVTAVLSE